MSLFFDVGDENRELSPAEMIEGLLRALQALGPRSWVVVVPPDFSRYHSRAGELTTAVFQMPVSSGDTDAGRFDGAY